MQPRAVIRYVDVSAVSRNLLSVTDAETIEGREAPSRARKVVRSGDTIFATIRPRLRRIALIDESLDGEIASTAFCVLRPKRDVVDPRFLYFSVLSNAFIEGVARHENGASYPAVRDGHVLQQVIAVPPLSEQRRIAEALSIVRRSILVQAALVRGVATLKQAAMHALFASGIYGGVEVETQFGSLPAAWTTVPLGECCDVQSGVTKGRHIEADEAVDVPYLRVANVQDGHIDLSEVKTIALRRSELPRFLLRDGDVLLTEGGDLDKLGRGFIWRGQIAECVHQNHVFAVRAHLDVLLPEFLAYLVQSPYGRAYFLAVAHKTTNLATINSTKLKAFPVPLPPLDEQREIVRVLEAIDRKIDLHERKRATLQELFDTLLNDLMTGRLRVDALAPDALAAA